MSKELIYFEEPTVVELHWETSLVGNFTGTPTLKGTSLVGKLHWDTHPNFTGTPTLKEE
jgi:hypothetical protein